MSPRPGQDFNFKYSKRDLRRAGVSDSVLDAIRLDTGDEELSAVDRGAISHQRALRKLGGNPIGSPPILYVDPADHESVPHHDEYIVCEVCQTPLNRFTSRDGGPDDEAWLHAKTWREYDHDPVPVAAPPGYTRDTDCDFCGLETQMYWVFIGNRMRLGSGNVINDYGTNWSACRACSPLVEDEDYEGLSNRLRKISPTLVGKEPWMQEQLLQSYVALWSTFIPSITERIYIGPKIEPTKLNPRMMPKMQLGLLKFWKHPSLTAMGRAAMRDFETSVPGVHAGDEDVFVVTKPAGQDMHEQPWRNHTDHLAAGVGVADLYWISENFTRLSVRAGKRFEKLVVTREEMPSSFGFMVFAEPIGEIVNVNENRPKYDLERVQHLGIRAVSWTLVPRGVWFNLYVQSDDGNIAPEEVERVRREYGYLICPNGGTGLEFGQEIPPADEGDGDFLATLLATWVLINQPGVAGVEAAPVDKKYARSYQREHKRPLPPVRLVELRKRPRPSKPTGESTGREWTERRYVKGHMKRQFYGTGRALRKWIYVDDYIAGPDGAPLREPGRTVKVLR